MPGRTVERHLARLRGEALPAYLDMLGFDLCRPRPGVVPTLVLGAGADTMFTRREVESVAAAHGAPVEFVPGMAHDMTLDPGWERVADRVGAWVDDLGSAAAAHRVAASPERVPHRPPLAATCAAAPTGVRP